MYKYGIILLIAVLTACGGIGEQTVPIDGSGGNDRVDGSGASTNSGGSTSDGGATSDGGGKPDGGATSDGGAQQSGGVGATTSDGGTGVGATTSDGGTGVGATGGGGGPTAICTPNQKVCNSGNARTCSGDGTFWVTETCDYACQNGACTGECAVDDTQCNGNTLQTCDGSGKWVDTTSCSFVCNAGACTGECIPDNKTCASDGKTPRVCNAAGQWTDSTECEFSCTDGNCTGACSNGDTTCLGDSTANCVDEAWVTDEDCPFVCNAGACAGVCVPDDTQCNGNSLQTCNASGNWGTGTPCSFACYSGSCTGVCVPGSKQCNGFDVEICNAQGQWEYSSTCAGDIHGTPTCGGAGVCGIDCQNGYEDCDGNLTCDSLSSAANCGSCGNSCSAASGFEAACENFGGTLSCGNKCATGTADCDGNAANGCEVNILTDNNNCGGCNETWHNMAICAGTCTAGVCKESGVDDRLFTGHWDDDEILTHNGDLFLSSTYYKEFRVRNFSGSRFDTYALNDSPYSIRNVGPIVVITTGDELDRGGLLKYDNRDQSFVVLLDGADGYSPERTAIDSTHFYWIERADPTSTPEQNLYRIALDGSSGPEFLAKIEYISQTHDNNYIVVVGNYVVYGPFGLSKIVVLNKNTGAYVTDVNYPIHSSVSTTWTPLVGNSNFFFYYDGSGVTQTTVGGMWDPVNAVSFVNWAHLDTELVTANSNDPGTIQFFNPVSKAQNTLTTPHVVSSMAVGTNYVYGAWNNRLYSLYRKARP